ncbi:MAG: response regulator [Proteobacteria bacterium]|nr:response regulator [Pseudomonadota bacterium]MCP4918059.1 response regulator [Pseudomonadota bacterium]
MTARPLVYVVDDEIFIRQVLEEMLQYGGFDVRTFERAEPALEAVRQLAPSVLVTDLSMPGPSGLELIEEVRKLEPDLPVVLASAHFRQGRTPSGFGDGLDIDLFVPKPFPKLLEFSRTLMALVERRGDAQPAAERWTQTPDIESLKLLSRLWLRKETDRVCRGPTALATVYLGDPVSRGDRDALDQALVEGDIRF